MIQAKNVLKKASKVIYKHSLIEKDDSILLGLSGGKDSLILLDLLGDRLKHLPFPFKVIACYIEIEEIGYKVDEKYLKERCESYSIPFVKKQFSIGDLDKRGKKPCFICSWNRRKKLFETARKLKCNKIALGHHTDDAIETLFMNMINHGSISSLPYHLKMFEGELEVIRPLLELEEKVLLKYTEENQLKTTLRDCPHEHITSRNKVKTLLEDAEKINKNARKNIFRAMNNSYPDYLPDYKK